MRSELGIYLNDHLAGAAIGLDIAECLALSATDVAEKLCFIHLKNEVAADRRELLRVIDETGSKQSYIRQAVGAVFARLTIWRMKSHGLGFGELGRFEMVELLTAGIHGKLLLWRTLEETSSSLNGCQNRDFCKLMKSASSQLSAIEIYRLHEATATFGATSFSRTATY